MGGDGTGEVREVGQGGDRGGEAGQREVGQGEVHCRTGRGGTGGRGRLDRGEREVGQGEVGQGGHRGGEAGQREVGRGEVGQGELGESSGTEGGR